MTNDSLPKTETTLITNYHEVIVSSRAAAHLSRLILRQTLKPFKQRGVFIRAGLRPGSQ